MIALGCFIVFIAAVAIDASNDPPQQASKTDEQLASEEAKQEKKEEAEKAEGEKQQEEAGSKEVVKEEPSKEIAVEKKQDPAATPATVSHGVKAKVTRVVDGDTIHVSMNGRDEEIRMLLIDTPETKHPSKPVEKFGPEASSFAKQTLEGKTVGIQVGSQERDKYGRVLAYVWVGDKTYQEMVLEKGLAATAYLYNDLTMLDQFHKAQDIARNAGIGVWSIPGYAHVDHDHGFHYNEEPKADPAPKPVQKPAPAPAPQPEPEPTPAPAPAPEIFANCTELRTVYPNGVPADHPAYQSKMDRDKDNFACEQ